MRIRLLEDEVASVGASLQALGLADVLEGDELRRVDGRCPVQDEEDRCRLHAAFGIEAKPLVCRQYPLVVTPGVQGYRVAVDPGCFHAWTMWRDGPVLAPSGSVAVAERDGASERLDAERALAEDLGTDFADLRALVGALVPDPDRTAEHLARRLREAPREEVLDLVPGRPSRELIRRMLASARKWKRAPAWPVLEAEALAWTVHVVRVQVLFGMGPTALAPRELALLGACGALGFGWSSPRLPRYAEGLAAWSRALRLPGFAATLLGDPRRLT